MVPADQHRGNVQPQLDLEEHDGVRNAKKVIIVDGPGEALVDSYTQVAINLDAGANQVLVSSAASKQIWVYAVTYVLSVDGTVSFQDEDDTPITGIMPHAANSGLGEPPSGNFDMPLWKLATNKDLEVDITDASLDGWITYGIISV